MHAYALLQAHLAMSEAIAALERERAFRRGRPVPRRRGPVAAGRALLAWIGRALTRRVDVGEPITPRLTGYPFGD